MFANHGALKKHEHKIEGINSRMDTIQAAILNVKIKYLPTWINQRREAAIHYNSLLSEIEEITTPKERDKTQHSYHLYVVKVKMRDQLFEFLKTKGIQCGIHYPKALTNLECYKNKIGKADYKISSSNEDKILSLPIFPEIEYDDLMYIQDNIKNFYSQK